MFKGFTFEDFEKAFKNDFACRKFLFRIKWRSGYCCKKCGFDKNWRGRTALHARCRRCDYDESITANTLFHKIQIPIRKAFFIVFQITVLKSGTSSSDLARIYGINQKTAWRFKRKVQEAMGLALTNMAGVRKKNTTKLKVDSISVTKRQRFMNGLQRINVTIRKRKKKSANGIVMICKGSVPGIEQLETCQLVNGRYVDHGKNIQLWNFKVWLTGTHHHCSEKYLQGYIDEYFFRNSFRSSLHIIWYTIIRQMIRAKPYGFIRNGV